MIGRGRPGCRRRCDRPWLRLDGRPACGRGTRRSRGHGRWRRSRRCRLRRGRRRPCCFRRARLWLGRHGRGRWPWRRLFGTFGPGCRRRRRIVSRCGGWRRPGRLGSRLRRRQPRVLNGSRLGRRTPWRRSRGSRGSGSPGGRGRIRRRQERDDERQSDETDEDGGGAIKNERLDRRPASSLPSRVAERLQHRIGACRTRRPVRLTTGRTTPEGVEYQAHGYIPDRSSSASTTCAPAPGTTTFRRSASRSAT